MLSSAYFLAKFRFDATNLQNFAKYFAKFANFAKICQSPRSDSTNSTLSRSPTRPGCEPAPAGPLGQEAAGVRSAVLLLRRNARAPASGRPFERVLVRRADFEKRNVEDVCHRVKQRKAS